MVSDKFSKRLPLELIALTLLREHDSYGFEMLKEIETRSQNKLVINLTTLYLVLKKLADKGYLSCTYRDSASKREQLRCYYHIEPAGEKYYHKLLEEHRKTMKGLELFFKNS